MEGIIQNLSIHSAVLRLNQFFDLSLLLRLLRQTRLAFSEKLTNNMSVVLTADAFSV